MARVISFLIMNSVVCMVIYAVFYKFKQLLSAIPINWKKKLRKNGHRQLVCAPIIKCQKWLAVYIHIHLIYRAEALLLVMGK